MGCGSGQNSTVTQTTSPPPQVLAAYQALLNQGTAVSQLPLQQWQGPTIAGFNPTQQTAFNEINAAQGSALPYINAAQGYLGAGADNPFSQVMSWSPSTLAQFENPYTQQVTQATQNLLNEQNAEQFNQADAAAASAGAFGGDRQAVLEAQMAQQQQLAEDPTLAGLQSQGFNTAAGLLGQQQNLQLQGLEGNSWLDENAAAMEAGLGQQEQGSLLSGASSELQAGALGQQLEQEELDVPIQQFEQQQAYPFQTTNFLAGITEGAGSGMGGMGSTTSPGPSMLGQIAGLGLTGLGLYNSGLFSGSGAGSSALSAADNNAFLSSMGDAIGGYAAGGWVTGPRDRGVLAVLNRGSRALEPRRGPGGLVPPLNLGDLQDVNAAISLAGGSPVPDMGSPHGAAGLPFTAPNSTQTAGGGDNTMQTIGQLAQIAGIAAMAFSDPALKHSRGESGGALDAIRHMRVDDARYRWEPEGAERPMLMADSVEGAAPHAVAGSAPARAVNMIELVPMLVQGMKELDRRTRRRAGGLVPGHHHVGFPRTLADGGSDGDFGGDGFAVPPLEVDERPASPVISEIDTHDASDGPSLPASRGAQRAPHVIAPPRRPPQCTSALLSDPLIAIGAGMMASRSPYFLSQLGEGLQSGLRYGQLQQRLAGTQNRAAPYVDNTGATMRLIYPGGSAFDTGLGTR